MGAKRPGAKRLGGETTRGGNGLGAKRPGFGDSAYQEITQFIHFNISESPLKRCHNSIFYSIFLNNLDCFLGGGGGGVLKKTKLVIIYIKIIYLFLYTPPT